MLPLPRPVLLRLDARAVVPRGFPLEPLLAQTAVVDPLVISLPLERPVRLPFPAFAQLADVLAPVKLPRLERPAPLRLERVRPPEPGLPVALDAVVIGAGIVGTSLADELTGRGWTDVTVLDRGPLPATGGSSSHAPGLVFATNSSETLSRFAQYTIKKFRGLSETSDRLCFNPVGGLEVATTEARMIDLHRKAGWAESWGIPGELLTAGQCAEMHPLLDADRILGGFHTPTDGLVKAVRAVAAQARTATARGATFRPHTEVLGIVDDGRKVTGVRTADGVIPADVVVCFE